MQRGLAVFAGGVVVEVRGAFGKSGGDYGPLGEALRRRHPQAFMVEAVFALVYQLLELFGAWLAGGGGLSGRECGVGERGASFDALDAGVAALFAHAESDQTSLQGVNIFKYDAVEPFDACGVFGGVAHGGYLGNVGAVAEAAGEGHLEAFFVRSFGEVVI